ncbi:hypothetical protein A0H81_04976 [Grifola frondosa]|uniref:Uncharacterized protein n=1 Tax=Grifola frondosa TaxID=5627 RepID=A0A1C7MG55_GRIFR|nr:hypothetical protein A0H81_04976 [Grifola frondosa]
MPNNRYYISRKAPSHYTARNLVVSHHTRILEYFFDPPQSVLPRTSLPRHTPNELPSAECGPAQYNRGHSACPVESSSSYH